MNVGAVLFTGLLAATIALWGIFSQRAITRRRATFDHIVRMEADKNFVDARRKFIELSKTPDGLAPWATADKESTLEAQNIRLVMNEFEIVAIGIERGILDFTTYERWFKATIIRFWKHGAPFAHALRLRTGHKNLFHEFEILNGWMEGNEKLPIRYRFLRIR